MTHPRLTRRAALAGLGAASLFPWLRPREARAGGAPRRRLIVWYTPCGTFEREFRPTGGEKDFKLGKILAPLAPFRDQLLLLGPKEPNAADMSNMRKPRGISMAYDGSNASASGEHANHTILTGRFPLTQDGQRVGAGVSLDQYVAQKTGAGDPFPSIQLGVNAKNPSPADALSYAAAGQPIPPENNPAQAFQTLFGGLGEASEADKQKKARRRVVLQTAAAQAKSLAPRLSGTDRARVEAQLAGLETLIKRLDQTHVCAAPTLASKDPKFWNQTDWNNYDKTPAITAAHLDLMATALACNLTHVASIQFGWAAANTLHPFVSPDADHWHHALSHDSAGNSDPTTAAVAAYIAVHAWHMQQLAGLLDRLRKLPESDGSTVLDHTTVLVVNELSDGAFHTWQNMPFFLVGSAGGHFKTGRYVTFDHRNHNDLLVSVMQAMGINEDTFGDASLCQGPLPGLT